MLDFKCGQSHSNASVNWGDANGYSGYNVEVKHKQSFASIMVL